MKIFVTYCGSWGYAKHYRALKAAIDKTFPSGVEMGFEATDWASGYLEVEMQAPEKKLLHSKKGGQGYIDTDEKVQSILGAIKAAMEG